MAGTQQVRIKPERNQDCVLQTKVLGQNTDDGIRILFQRNLTAHNVTVPAEFPLPDTVAEQNNVAVLGLLVIRLKVTPQLGMNAQQGKEARSNSSARQLFRLALAAQVPLHLPVHSHGFKAVRL